MNDSQLNLSQMQTALTRMCSKSKLQAYVQAGSLSCAEQSLLQSIPMEQLLVYSEGTDSKRHFFALDTFRLTSKAVEKNTWTRIIDDYWQNHAVQSAIPSQALSALPAFLRRLSSQYDEAVLWADLAEYEMCLLEVGNTPAPVSVSTKAYPKRISHCQKLLTVNPSVRIRSFAYNIPRLCNQLKRGRKVNRDGLRTSLNMVFYSDPVTGKVRVQQVGNLVVEILTLATNQPLKVKDAVAFVSKRFGSISAAAVEANLHSILEQLRQSGVLTVAPARGKHR